MATCTGRSCASSSSSGCAAKSASSRSRHWSSRWGGTWKRPARSRLDRHRRRLRLPGLVEGKAGLVTGAAGGGGRATALALAREGAAGVLVCDLEERRADGFETVRLIEQEGGHAEFVAGDVRVEADCRAAVERTV